MEKFSLKKPQVWLFDDHLGNAGEMGKYGFNGREAPEEYRKMGLPAVVCMLGLDVLHVSGRVFCSVFCWGSKKNGPGIRTLNFAYFSLESNMVVNLPVRRYTILETAPGGFQCPALGFQVSCKTRDQSIGNGLVGLCGAELYLGLKSPRAKRALLLVIHLSRSIVNDNLRCHGLLQKIHVTRLESICFSFWSF